MPRSSRIGILVVALLLVIWAGAEAAVTPAQRKEITAIKSEITKLGSLISKKKIEDADTTLGEIDKRIEALKSEGVAEADPLLATTLRQLDLQKKTLAKLKNGGKPVKAEPVSFVEDVAPILEANCTSCHSDAPKGGLRLDSYSAMEKGGRNGPLVVTGNPQRSSLVLRCTTTDERYRMPKDADPLSQDEIKTLATWVSEGAKFDGKDKSTLLADLKVEGGPNTPAMPKVEIAKPTGGETVSFVNDIAPTFVGVCGGCHGGNNPRGGFSLVTFEKLMQGGESGRVILPGNPDGSRLWRLVNADDTPVMPQGQGRITRKWHANLKKWITEGAKYDGGDPKKPLRDLIPTEAELEARALAKMTPEQFEQMRMKDAKEKFEAVISSKEPNIHESAEFICLGDVPEERLKEVDGWASTYVKTLRSTFSVKDEPLWKGKLAIFVFSDRFGYEEYNQSINRREVPKEIVGHANVTPNLKTAVVVLQDVGDDPTATNAGLELNLYAQMTSAYLQKGGGDIPDWMLQGTGYALAGNTSAGKGNPCLQAMKLNASGAVRSNVSQPQDVFKGGTFAPADVPSVGYSLVEFLLRNGNASFGKLIMRLQAGDKIDAAIMSAYRQDTKTLGAAYISTLGGAGPRTRKGGK